MIDDMIGMCERAIRLRLAPSARVRSLAERAGPQGYSGATLRYFDVAYEDAGTPRTAALALKDAAPLHERRVAVRLSDQGVPGAPFAYAPDLEADAAAPLLLQDVTPDAADPPDTQARAALALAQIHAAHMGRGAELPWLPRADHAYFATWLAEGCCLGIWRHMFADAAFDHGFGVHWPAPAAGSGARFAERFGRYDEPLRRAAAQFVADMDALLADEAGLTLTHADLHDNHVLVHRGQPYIIDWGQARYGPPDIDLPNYFRRDGALAYRDALAALGHDIPREAFLARFDAAQPYVGLKYFSIGLWNWRYNGQDDANVWHFLKLIIDEPAS